MWYCASADLIRRFCRYVQHGNWSLLEQLFGGLLYCPLFLDLLRGKATWVVSNEADS